MKLKLHEAIAVVLLNVENRTASVSDIAIEINRRELYKRKDGETVPDFQVMMRAKLSNGNYSDWFEWIEPASVRMK